MGIFFRSVFLIVGFFLLVKGADAFVDGAGGIARRFGISPLIVGMTIVAFGTSAPEAAISISAGIRQSNAIAVSNAIGSNIFNLLMVAGVCALFHPLPVRKITMVRDFPYSILAAAVLAALCLDNFSGASLLQISRMDGVVLMLFFCVFLYFNLKEGADSRDFFQNSVPQQRQPFWVCLVLLLCGLAGITLGGQLVVSCSEYLARVAGISETVIGLTVVSLGTSLPELVTGAAAARKGETDIAVGNVIGSNVFNVLFVLGLAAVVRPLTVEWYAIYDLGIFFLLSLLVYFFVVWKRKISRPMGILMVFCYAIYMVYIFKR